MDHDKLKEALEWARRVVNLAPDGWRQLGIIVDAAESTLPKTKMVEVWRVEWAQLRPEGWCGEAEHWPSKAGAESRVQRLEQLLNPGISCIRITGPHQQEVPA